jgi:hypothetical protein
VFTRVPVPARSTYAVVALAQRFIDEIEILVGRMVSRNNIDEASLIADRFADWCRPYAKQQPVADVSVQFLALNQRSAKRCPFAGRSEPCLRMAATSDEQTEQGKEQFCRLASRFNTSETAASMRIRAGQQCPKRDFAILLLSRLANKGPVSSCVHPCQQPLHLQTTAPA